MFDCVIVGGGPAGLTAAVYLARYHLSTALIDRGNSRAALIPLSRNHAGFPDGVNGKELLARMRRQLEPYPLEIVEGEVDDIELRDRVFHVGHGDQTIQARTVLMATGVINHRPKMADDIHNEALALGALRYCPVCDGYEITDKAVAVVGSGARVFAEAKFLRSYTASVTIFPDEGTIDLNDAQRDELLDLGVTIIESPPLGFFLADEGLEIDFGDGSRRFASLYPALGSDIQAALALSMGADRTEGGCLWVDAHQRTTIPGLYAAGDVVLGLDQMSHAMGQAAVAATAIRNDLADSRDLRRQPTGTDVFSLRMRHAAE